MFRRVLVLCVLIATVALGACTNPSGGGSGGGSSAAPAASQGAPGY